MINDEECFPVCTHCFVALEYVHLEGFGIVILKIILVNGHINHWHLKWKQYVLFVIIFLTISRDFMLVNQRCPFFQLSNQHPDNFNVACGWVLTASSNTMYLTRLSSGKQSDLVTVTLQADGISYVCCTTLIFKCVLKAGPFGKVYSTSPISNGKVIITSHIYKCWTKAFLATLY